MALNFRIQNLIHLPTEDVYNSASGAQGASPGVIDAAEKEYPSR